VEEDGKWSPTENVKVVLRCCHHHCYKSSPLWSFVREGLSRLMFSYG
jgi:hypothetical protein